MKTLKTKLALIVALSIPLPVMASEIKQQAYSYQFDDVASTISDTFVVCDDCRDDKLTKKPVPIKLAIRMSSEPLIAPPSKPVEQQTATPVKASPTLPALIGTIHFEFDKAVISTLEKANLDSMTAKIPKDQKVSVVGYTCDIGSQKYNLTLSDKRAKSVAAYLISKGTATSYVEGKGECCPVSGSDKRLNRRVEVTIEEKD